MGFQMIYTITPNPALDLGGSVKDQYFVDAVFKTIQVVSEIENGRREIPFSFNTPFREIGFPFSSSSKVPLSWRIKIRS